MAVESLKTLRRRVRSVKNIKQITRAMEMVSAAKLRRAQGTLEAGRPYAAHLEHLLARVASGSALGSHPLFQPREGNRKVLVLFTSDRGLCGSFNANLIKRAEETMKAEPETQWRLYCIGKKGRDYFAKRGADIIDTLTGFKAADVDAAQQVTDTLLEIYRAGEVDSIWLLFSEYVSTVVQRPTLTRYLHLDPAALGLEDDPDAKGHATLDYILEPSPERIFEALLPQYLRSRIYITMAEMFTSEHSARMFAMNNATKNCKELSDQLTLQMNKARQSTITKELLDIVGGAEAQQAG